MPAIRFLGWVSVALLGCGRLGFDAAPDAAIAVDAAPDAPPIPLCDHFPNALYCSDFEGGDLAGAGASGAVAVPGAGWNGTDGYSATVVPGDSRVLQFDLPSAVTAGELHIGGRMVLSAGPQSADYVVVAQALSPIFEKVSFDLTSRDRTQIVNDVNAAGGLKGDDNSFPRGRWACFELVILVAPAGAGGKVTVLLDGAPAIVGFSDLETKPLGGFTRIEIGAISSTGNTAPETLVFDNWVISTAAIGCP